MKVSRSVLPILSLRCIVSAVPVIEKWISSDNSYHTSWKASARNEVQKTTTGTASYTDGRLFNIDGITQYFAGMATERTIAEQKTYQRLQVLMLGGWATSSLTTTWNTQSNR